MMTSKAQGVDVDALIASHTRAAPGGICHAGAAISRLDPDVRAKLGPVMADVQRYAARNVADILTALGETVGRGSVERHRRGECKCPR